MHFKCKIKIYIAIVLLGLIIIPINSYAVIRHSYTFDENRQAIESPLGYEINSIYTGENIPSGKLLNPKDIYIYNNSSIYILDSGKNRVVILARNFEFENSIDMLYLNGNESPMNDPTGIFVANPEEIYIADPLNQRVICINSSGEIIKTFTKPDSVLFPQERSFNPTKVIRDEGGNVFCISIGIYQGAVGFDSQGEFIGFYGANDVTISVRMLLDQFYKRIFSKENRDRFAAYIPIEYTSFDIDTDGFVYTCTEQISDNLLMIKKLNPLGENIMIPLIESSYQQGFGDLNPIIDSSGVNHTRFIDVRVDSRGNINALEFSRGRVFKYDPDGNLMFVFGGFGNRLGSFITPLAIETLDDDILILDSGSNTIHIFKPTNFGLTVFKAMELYQDGRYVESIDPWHDVLKHNSNFNIAYLGIGKAQLEMREFELAMNSFETAGYLKGYDDAYKYYRTIRSRELFSVLFGTFLILITLYILVQFKYIKKKIANFKERFVEFKIIDYINQRRKPFTNALSISLHPIDGYMDMFYLKKEKLYVANFISGILFFSFLLKERYSGFLFAVNNTQSIAAVLSRSVGLIFIFTIVNWSICTLLNGNGTARKIWIVSNYSVVPLILSNFLILAATNYFTLNESIFVSYIGFVGYAYTGLLLIKGLESIHEYTFKKSILSIVYTGIGMILLGVLLIILFSLIQQIVAFVITIIREIDLRS